MHLHPWIAVDIIIMHGDKYLLIKRKNATFKGMWAIPGGGVGYGERVEDAAVREAKEETGLDVELKGIVGVYSDPDRDPRRHTISVVFAAEPVDKDPKVRAGSDAGDARWFSKNELPKLAFDHNKIIEDYLRLKKHKAGVAESG